MKDFLEKLKNNQKTQAAVICSVVGAVLVLAAAITIPVALHNRVKVGADAESAAITAETELTESASVPATEPEIVSVSEATTEPTTAETIAQTANNNASAGKNTPANTNKGSGSNKSDGSDSSAKKPNGGSSGGGQSQQKPPVQNEEPAQQKENYDWSQAEVDALIAEAYAYGRTLGLEPATNLTPSNSSWNQPIRTWYGKQETINGVKSEIRHLKWLLDRDGLDPTGIPCYQIYAERYYEAAAGGYCWQFYVMS